jgi:hypothetical protein
MRSLQLGELAMRAHDRGIPSAKNHGARVRVMGYYSEPESLALRDRNCLPTPSLCFCYPARLTFVGPGRQPWNRHRRLPGTTLMMHGAPALVLA